MDLQGAPGSFQESLIARVKKIILTPSTEWDVIEKEPAEIGGLYRNYILILAAIGPVAAMIKSVVFGYSFLGITYRPGIGQAVGTAITTYVITLVGVYILALVIDALAPSFGAEKNRIQAFKLATYSGTAAWVTGIFGLLPGLSVLTLLGIYSIYLLYVGLPKLMKAPADKAVGYTAVTIVAAIVVAFVSSIVLAPIVGLFGGGPALTGPNSSVSGTLSVPGVGKVDMDKLDALGKQAEAASQQLESGKTNAVAPAVLESLLPTSLSGLSRSKISSSSAGLAGVGGSSAEARYEGGDSNITLSITDMAAVGAIAGIGGALNVQSNEQTATGYKKTGSVDGRMTSENWDSSGKSGSYSTVFANRFMVEARGTGTSMDVLKAAVAEIGSGSLESLAK
ncbi:Yip1 family protein [Aquisediminimonas profunda]|uniref:Yip1 family protein n=1 Tax=Aquisediminimonas profunda TaxID=1550733 RepID=UPI001C638C48|nr:Yip1 family protein [Aquisediminimonas profunda]